MAIKEKELYCPQITIDGRQDCISIGRDVIRILGYPNYISILKNDSQKTIAIRQSESREVLSFKVPEGFPDEKKKMFRIYSRAFTSDLLETYQLDQMKSHAFIGRYVTEYDAVVFSLERSNNSKMS